VTAIALSAQPLALARYVASQVGTMFPDGSSVEPDDLMQAVPGSLERLEHCFSRIQTKYYFDGKQALFNHLNGDQYATWLYMLANQLFREGSAATVCSKIYLLNKALHGIDLYYEVQMPDIFCLVHPLGTVLGRAQYQDYLLVYQRCGVGSNHDAYPTLGRYVTLRPGSSVLGTCMIGDGVTLGAESLLLDKDLPAGSLYIGNPRDHLVKPYPATPALWRKS